MIKGANKESIRLYRDVLRATRLYTWTDESGKPWSKILRDNARKEFETARYESDSLVVAKLLFSGRDFLNLSQEKYAEIYAKMIQPKPPNGSSSSR